MFFDGNSKKNFRLTINKLKYQKIKKVLIILIIISGARFFVMVNRIIVIFNVKALPLFFHSWTALFVDFQQQKHMIYTMKSGLLTKRALILPDCDSIVYSIVKACNKWKKKLEISARL